MSCKKKQTLQQEGSVLLAMYSAQCGLFKNKRGTRCCQQQTILSAATVFLTTWDTAGGDKLFTQQRWAFCAFADQLH